jgi:hypothetical protein
MGQLDDLDSQLLKEHLAWEKENRRANRPATATGPFGITLNKTQTLVGCSVYLLGFVFWLVYTLSLAPRWKDPRWRLENTGPFRNILAQELPQAAQGRLAFMHAGNLDIYLDRAWFEALPEARRAVLVDRLGKAWAAETRWYTLPALEIRDRRSGQVLAHYSCLLSAVSLGGPR